MATIRRILSIGKKQKTQPTMQWLIGCLGLLVCMSLSGSMMAQRSKTVIVAYVFPQNNPIQPGEIAARKLTRINYAFANLQGGQIVNGFNADDENLRTLVALKHDNPRAYGPHFSRRVVVVGQFFRHGSNTRESPRFH